MPSWVAAGDRVHAKKDGFGLVREEILSAIRSHKATGVAVAVVHRGKIVWEEGFGWANREADIKVSARTPFCLASLTKPFTTTALMTLVAAGKISLDDAANRYLGDADGLRGNAEGATIRLLGAHAAGLPLMFEMFPKAGAARQPSGAALLKDYGTLAYAPGKVYEYSNIGYAALGMIGSKVTGLEFGELLKRQVLGPLGLRDSFFDTDRTRLANGAVLYDEKERAIPEYVTATPPSGELYVSAHDVARFAMFNLKNHLPDQAAILSDHWIDELHRPVFPGPSGVATSFGWFLGHTKSGLEVIFKDGGQPGVSTVLCMVPEENLACLVLTNRSDNGELAEQLVDQMASTVIPDWTPPDISMTAPKSDFNGDSVYSGKWIGKLRGGGIEMMLSLEIMPDGRGTLSIGNAQAAAIASLKLQGAALVGKAVGRIESEDAIRNRATSLSLKLIADGDRLTGRVLAGAESPGELASLPYVVALSRSIGSC